MKILYGVVWCPRMRRAEGVLLTRQKHVTSPPLRFLLPGSRVSKHPPPSEIMSHQTGIQGKSEIFLRFLAQHQFDKNERATRDACKRRDSFRKSMKMWIRRICQLWFHSDLRFTLKIIFKMDRISVFGMARVVFQWSASQSRARGQRLQLHMHPIIQHCQISHRHNRVSVHLQHVIASYLWWISAC